MKPFNVEKIVVQAKSRALKATWTMEKAQDFGFDVEDELAKILQQEIDNEITMTLLDTQGWTKIMIKDWRRVDSDWCDTYIKNPYRCFGHFWYFEDQKDAHFFLLKWGS